MSTMPVLLVLDYKAVKHVVPNQSNHLNCHSVTAVFTTIRWRHFKKTILSKSLSVILHLLADNIIPAVLKRRSTAALLDSVELALTKALAIKG